MPKIYLIIKLHLFRRPNSLILTLYRLAKFQLLIQKKNNTNTSLEHVAQKLVQKGFITTIALLARPCRLSPCPTEKK